MTKIEWTDESWNPVLGCTKISTGCAHCYAETFAERFRGVPGHPFEQGFDLRLVPEKLAEPLRWKKPRRVFVNSMSDLFHEGVPNSFIAAVVGVMHATPHVFQILTKRPWRMQQYFRWLAEVGGVGKYLRGDGRAVVRGHFDATAKFDQGSGGTYRALDDPWISVFNAAAVSLGAGPLPNVWLGVSAENQEWADKRIPLLLQTPAAVRFLSAEPLLGAIDLRPYLDSIDWVIVGGESGPQARPCCVDWIEQIVAQCRAAAVPCFVKQVGRRPYRHVPVADCGSYLVIQRDDATEPDKWLLQQIRMQHPKGGDPAEWPEALRVREFPAAGSGEQ